MGAIPLQGVAEPQRAALYLSSAPDRNGDEKADEEMEAENDEVQHRLSSLCLWQLSCLVHISNVVPHSPSLRANQRQQGCPL